MPLKWQLSQPTAFPRTALSHVHYCVYCGASKSAESPTMLEPSCEECGCVLS